jgi:hypothetical protein
MLTCWSLVCRSLVVALGNSELRKIIFPRLVQQLQTCIMEAASFRLGQGEPHIVFPARVRSSCLLFCAGF